MTRRSSSRPRPWLAFLLSCLGAGLGQLYAGFPRRAALVFSAQLALAAVSVWLLVDPNGGAIGMWLGALLGPVVLLVPPVDAALVARSGTPAGVKRWLVLGVCIVLFAGLSQIATRVAAWVRSDVSEAFRVPSGAMVPTLYPGDCFLVDKRAYLDHPPRRGDVVVFWAAHDGAHLVPADSNPGLPREHLLKRVVAGPGDRVRVAGRRVYLNGTELPVSPAGTANAGGHELELFAESIEGVTHTIADDPAFDRPDFPEIVVPPGRYFVLGDNRDYSSDSRYLGTVRRSEVIGKASRIYFSRHPATGHLAWERIGMRIE